MINCKNILKKSLRCFYNNIFTNNIIIFLRLEDYCKERRNYWRDYRFNPKKTLQENAGYSTYRDVQDTLEKIHGELEKAKMRYLQKGAKVLDIGCGPGLFLSDFEETFNLTGVDFNQEIIAIASQRLPNAKFIPGDFLTAKLDKKFNLICSISMLEYVSRMDIKKFFKKISVLLETGGILFLVYPHALNFWDTLYPDLEYIQYSPRLIEKVVEKYLKIIKHCHIFDARRAGRYDTFVYKNPNLDRLCKNSSLLIAQKI